MRKMQFFVLLAIMGVTYTSSETSCDDCQGTGDTTYYPSPTVIMTTVTPGMGGAATPSDADATQPEVAHTPQSTPTVESDADGDGYPADSDCDDTRENVYPGALDDCAAGDEDCDGNIDEDADQDGDGYTRCTGDCDDQRSDVYPGAEEVPQDRIDQDCDTYDRGNASDELLGTYFGNAEIRLDDCTEGDGGTWTFHGVEMTVVPSATYDDYVLRWSDTVFYSSGSDWVSITGAGSQNITQIDHPDGSVEYRYSGLSLYGTGTSSRGANCSYGYVSFEFLLE